MARTAILFNIIDQSAHLWVCHPSLNVILLLCAACYINQRPKRASETENYGGIFVQRSQSDTHVVDLLFQVRHFVQ